jgi:FG-GAP repeat
MIFVVTSAFGAPVERLPDTILGRDCVPWLGNTDYSGFSMGGWVDLDGDGARDLVLPEQIDGPRVWPSARPAVEPEVLASAPPGDLFVVAEDGGPVALSLPGPVWPDSWSEYALDLEATALAPLGDPWPITGQTVPRETAGDVDGDGHTDFLSTWTSLLLTGAGARVDLPLPYGFFEGLDAVGDVNADGFDDLVVTTSYGSDAQLALYFGSPSGPSPTPHWQIDPPNASSTSWLGASVLLVPGTDTLVVLGQTDGACDQSYALALLHGAASASPTWDGPAPFEVLNTDCPCPLTPTSPTCDSPWLAWEQEVEGTTRLAAVEQDGVTFFDWDGAVPTAPASRWAPVTGTTTALGFLPRIQRSLTDPRVPGPLALLWYTAEYGGIYAPQGDLVVFGWSPTGEALGDGVPTAPTCEAPPVETGETGDTATTDTGASEEDGAGCGCATGGARGAPWLAVAWVILRVRGRRR